MYELNKTSLQDICLHLLYMRAAANYALRWSELDKKAHCLIQYTPTLCALVTNTSQHDAKNKVYPFNISRNLGSRAWGAMTIEF